MKPEDIDKLFKERLGPSSPTTPPDLWNRLQDGMETDMPATIKVESKPRGFMWLSYSIAATIALLLSVGVVFYSVQNGTAPMDRDGLAERNGLKPEQPLVIPEQTNTDRQLAQTTDPATELPADEVLVEPIMPNTAATEVIKKPEDITKQVIDRAEPKAEAKKTIPKNSTKGLIPAQQLVAQTKQPAMPDAAQKVDFDNTGESAPVTLAASSVNLNAQPVEIIIKRAVAVQEVEAGEELNGFEKKQKLAKNIFKQVRNLSNGERVELSELGINADRIALETQIGKQKISKVIQL